MHSCAAYMCYTTLYCVLSQVVLYEHLYFLQLCVEVPVDLQVVIYVIPAQQGYLNWY